MNPQTGRDAQLADWAESDEPTFDPAVATSGPESQRATQELLRRAAGRPRLDGGTTPGAPAPRRQVRLPQDLSARVDRLAQQQHRSPSELMRVAIGEYVARHAPESGD